jgi:hypothetical protein
MPKRLPLETIQAICNALNCRLSDFCIIEPDVIRDAGVGYHKRPSSGNSKNDFPDPFHFRIHELE